MLAPKVLTLSQFTYHKKYSGLLSESVNEPDIFYLDYFMLYYGLELAGSASTLENPLNTVK